MKKLLLCATATIAAASALAVAEGCSSSSASATASDAGEGEQRVIACPPATDASIAAAADAGLVVKIMSPTDGQKFATTDKVSLKGSGSAPDEASITDPTRMIWNVGNAVKGVNPDGEGPEDTSGPYPAGTYTVRFDVSTKACVTGAASVTITVQ
ncbi:MAG TPA: hypothetical protein VIF62_10710 [Labilithrix sp.]|jgi:hypothetical protein